MEKFIDAIKTRHSVRAFKEQALSQDAAEVLNKKVAELNKAVPGVRIQLVLNEPKAFMSPMARYGKFSGCSNYFVLTVCDSMGPKALLEESVGTLGEIMVFEAQLLGLNSCWVGLTYGKVPGAFTLEKGERIVCVIALGYGETQGVEHKRKTAEQVSNLTPESPEWFRRGVESALLAPTAVNQQKFFFEYLGEDKVSARKTFSMMGYTWVDLGIAKLHFEIAAGKENFQWA